MQQTYELLSPLLLKEGLGVVTPLSQSTSPLTPSLKKGGGIKSPLLAKEGI